MKKKCGIEECKDEKCSLNLFLEGYEDDIKEGEDLLQFFFKKGFYSHKHLFPKPWIKEYDAIKNEIYQEVTNSNNYDDGKHYLKFSSKDHPSFFKNSNLPFDISSKAWSILLIEKKVFHLLQRQMIEGKWGRFEGIKKFDILVDLFEGEDEKFKESVPYEVFMQAVFLFYEQYPIWKKINSIVEKMQVGKDHKKIDKQFIKIWFENLFFILLKYHPNDLINDHSESHGEETSKQSILVKNRFVQKYLDVLIGVAYSILPDYLSITEKFDSKKEFVYLWAIGLILNTNEKNFQNFLFNSDCKDGSFLITMSLQYLFDLSTTGFHKLTKDSKYCENNGPFVICFKDKGTCAYRRISFNNLEKTNFTEILSSDLLSKCFYCQKPCFLDDFNPESHLMLNSNQSLLSLNKSSIKENDSKQISPTKDFPRAIKRVKPDTQTPLFSSLRINTLKKNMEKQSNPTTSLDKENIDPQLAYNSTANIIQKLPLSNNSVLIKSLSSSTSFIPSQKSDLLSSAMSIKRSSGETRHFPLKLVKNTFESLPLDSFSQDVAKGSKQDFKVFPSKITGSLFF
eukprot:TRINITY_DN3781_c0_g2_i1.p1 TRINITY_DN3781_c0_g2~~TRINITY_DN3781_c0_g2_i1.p1  ORF type:complete len:567 (+),score=162.39 TRINITY_DN3781_c0_g2_i1:31-1731(+)